MCRRHRRVLQLLSGGSAVAKRSPHSPPSAGMTRDQLLGGWEAPRSLRTRYLASCKHTNEQLNPVIDHHIAARVVLQSLQGREQTSHMEIIGNYSRQAECYLHKLI